jgi:hypothetical protein
MPCPAGGLVALWISLRIGIRLICAVLMLDELGGDGRTLRHALEAADILMLLMFFGNI